MAGIQDNITATYIQDNITAMYIQDNITAMYIQDNITATYVRVVLSTYCTTCLHLFPKYKLTTTIAMGKLGLNWKSAYFWVALYESL